MGRVARALFSLSREQSRFVRSLAYAGDGSLRRRMEEIGESFVEGYHLALREDPERLAEALTARIGPELHGFAYEGVGLGLMLLDSLTPWRRDRFASFSRGPGRHHVYMLHVGAGWILARLPVSLPRFLSRLDPLLGWLTLDGFGFHEAFYRWSFTVESQRLPAKVSGHAVPPFDTGVGRRLWLTPEVEAGHVPRIIAAFPAERQGDLWAGVGEACAFAGGRGPVAAEELRRAAGPLALHLAQGAAFAAKVRARGGNPAPHTETACRVLCGMSAAEAAEVTDQALPHLPAGGEAFAAWRQRTRNLLRLAATGARRINSVYNRP